MRDADGWVLNHPELEVPPHVVVLDEGTAGLQAKDLKTNTPQPKTHPKTSRLPESLPTWNMLAKMRISILGALS